MKSAHRHASRTKRRYIADPFAVMRTLELHTEPSQEAATGIMLILRNAFNDMRAGTADCEMFDRIADAFNAGLIRAESIDPLLLQVFIDAAQAMREADAIYGRHHRYGFTGPGLQAVAAALDAYEQVLRLSNPIQMKLALEESARRKLAQAHDVRALDL